MFFLAYELKGMADFYEGGGEKPQEKLREPALPTRMALKFCTNPIKKWSDYVHFKIARIG